MSDSSKPERGNDERATVAPSSAPASLFNTLPPSPVDPASTVRAPSNSKSPGEGMDIIMPKARPAPVIATAHHGANGADADREALLTRLRERAGRLSADQIAALLKLVE